MATTAVNSEKAFGEVLKHAESIRNDEAHTIEVMDSGDAWAQGDVLLIRLDRVPAKAQKISNPSPQLAPGETQGSRHILSNLDGMNLYRRADATALDGPIIESPCAFTVTHPEHGDITLPAGVYGVRYQRAFAEELRRVQD